jgi:hypothetical protein
LGIYLHTPELRKAGDASSCVGKLEMLQASSSGRCIFILLNFEKLEMHLHALESWRCIIMCWKAGDVSSCIGKLEMYPSYS